MAESQQAPTAGSTSGVQTRMIHTLPSLHVRVAIEPSVAQGAAEKFTLSSDDGKYTKTLTVKDDRIDGTDSVDLVFDNLKTSQKYTLEVDPGGGTAPYKLFEDVPYQEIVDFYSVLEEADTLAPPEQDQSDDNTSQDEGDESGGGGDDSGGGSFGGDPDPSDTTMQAIVDGEEPEEGREINWDVFDLGQFDAGPDTTDDTGSA